MALGQVELAPRPWSVRSEFMVKWVPLVILPLLGGHRPQHLYRGQASGHAKLLRPALLHVLYMTDFGLPESRVES